MLASAIIALALMQPIWAVEDSGAGTPARRQRTRNFDDVDEEDKPMVWVLSLVFILVFCYLFCVQGYLEGKKLDKEKEAIKRAEDQRARGRTAGEMGGVVVVDAGVRRVAHNHVAEHCVVSFPGGQEWQLLIDMVHSRKLRDNATWKTLKESEFINSTRNTDGSESVLDLQLVDKYAKKVLGLRQDVDGGTLRGGDIDLACVFVDEIDYTSWQKSS